jgi:hypothetical protein
VKEVQAFLGFANFYYRFIARYLRVAQPLTELTKTKVETNIDDFLRAAMLN